MKITFDEKVGKWDDGMTQDEHGTLWRQDVAPGAAAWLRGSDCKIAVLSFSCPCGCHAIIQTPVTVEPRGYGWKWDGNLEAPTLSPSILRTTGCRWHGYLQAGVFKTC